MIRALGALALVLVLALVLGHLKRLKSTHGSAALAWRWFSGAPLDGTPRTDARWFTRPTATRALTATGHASRWQHQPRAARAAARTVGALGGTLAAWGLVMHRAATLAGLEGAAAAAIAWAAWSAWRAARAGSHHRAWVRPLHRALAHPLGVPSSARPASWLEIPPKFYAREGAQITLWLPEHFVPSAEAKRLITETVCAKLALEDPRADWGKLQGAKPRVIFTVQVPPPAKVRLADVLELVRKAAAHAPLVGLGRAERAVYADLDGDSPHVLVSMQSGAGKSVTMRAAVAQILRNGGVALVLDIKRLSHAWARGLPNVRYCRDIADIHEALLWLREELDRRNELADEGADVDGNTDHVDVGPRLVVLAEEMNATAGRLAAYWRKTKGPDDVGTSPAIEALTDALFMGRQVRVNVFAVAQMLTARTIGGPEARENMGVRILGRYTLNNWRMLVPEIWPAPRASRHKGRVQVCVAGEARETQVMFTTPAEARELALSGTVTPFPAGGPLVAASSARPGLHVVGGRAPIGLARAVAEGVVPIGLEAVRKARQRDPEFPGTRGEGDGGELLYDPDELAAWARNRPRASVGA